MKVLSIDLEMWEYRFATCDELDLERLVIEQGVPTDDFTREGLAQDKRALREIDRLKIDGTYDEERRRLFARVPDDPLNIRGKIDSDFLRAVDNLLAGLNSSDLEQRARFRRLYEAYDLESKTPYETRDLIMVLETAKRRPKVGRPAICPPWENVVEHLDKMRLLVATGVPIPEAARNAATAEGRMQHASRAKYFEGLYRKRVALRAQ